MPRWRGFDNPFGDIHTNLDGTLTNTPLNPSGVDGDPGVVSTCYIITDPEKYTDSLTDV
jgi:hypothetical protein